MVAMDVDWIEAGAPTYQETDGKWVRVITVRKMGQWRVSLTQEMVSLYCCMIQADLMTSKVEKKTHTHTHLESWRNSCCISYKVIYLRAQTWQTEANVWLMVRIFCDDSLFLSFVRNGDQID